jgi:hypothetical protein
MVYPYPKASDITVGSPFVRSNGKTAYDLRATINGIIFAGYRYGSQLYTFQGTSIWTGPFSPSPPDTLQSQVGDVQNHQYGSDSLYCTINTSGTDLATGLHGNA